MSRYLLIVHMTDKLNEHLVSVMVKSYKVQIQVQKSLQIKFNNKNTCIVFCQCQWSPFKMSNQCVHVYRFKLVSLIHLRQMLQC